MLYTVRQSILDHFPDLPTLFGVDQLGPDQNQKIDAAIQAASQKVDSFLGRYDLPFAIAPMGMAAWCNEIVIYQLAVTHDNLTDDIRKRYDDALAYLNKVGDGKLQLSFLVDPNQSDDDGQDTAPDNSTGAFFQADPIRMTTANLKRL